MSTIDHHPADDPPTRWHRRISPRARIIAAVVVGAVAVLVLAGPLALNAVLAGRPVIGVSVSGAPEGVGRWTVWSDVDRAVRLVTDAQAHRAITVRAGDVRQPTTWADLGLVDASAAFHDTLLSAGRHGGWWSDVTTQTRAFWGLERVAPPTPHLDPGTLDAFETALAQRVDTPATNASITVEGSTVDVVGDMAGTRLDDAAARSTLTDAVRAGRASVALPTEPVPADITADTLAPTATTLRAAAAQPLILAAGGTTVTVPPQHVLAALPVTSTPGDAVIGVDPAALADDVTALAAAVDQPARPRIWMADVVVAQGADGRRLDRDAAATALTTELTARAAGHSSPRIEVPVAALPAPVQEATPGAFTGDQTVHLTFDDGPGAHTEQILDILRDKGVHATFYVVGERAQRYPDSVRRILAEGHRLGSHSMTHANLPTLSPAQIQAELADTQAVLLDITGVRPTAFRPPYGAVNDAVRAAAAAESLSIELWTVDPEDWRQPGADVVRDRVLAAAQPGSVVLLHVLHQDTVDALPQIIDGLRAKGLALD
jgi:peptidoglycan/xylan/chitin deacetylase (PgdA/CDA1 family)